MPRVALLRKAVNDLARIMEWLSSRSPAGSERWLSAFQETIARLEAHPEQCGMAPESEYVGEPIRQAIFSTRRGIPYRVLYLIVDAEVRILRIRGAGQDLLQASEF